MSVLVIANEDLKFTEVEAYQEERLLAEMEVDSSHPTRQYIWAYDHLKQVLKPVLRE